MTVAFCPEKAEEVSLGLIPNQLEDLVDQIPSHTERFGGSRHTHPINSKALQDPASDPVSELGAVIRASQGGLEDLCLT